MRRLTIGIDIDGTLYNWTAAANQAVMAQFGCDDPGEHEHWDHLKAFLGGDERWHWIWSREAAPYVFGADAMEYPGCVSVVNDLCREHDIHFVTHRNPAKTGAITARWLDARFENYKGIHVLDNTVKKHEVLAFDIFIDDKAETIEEFCGTPFVLPVMPVRLWNAHVDDPIVERFNDWSEVPAIVERCA
jgi:uncharacterized HAD superfamily protein